LKESITWWTYELPTKGADIVSQTTVGNISNLRLERKACQIVKSGAICLCWENLSDGRNVVQRLNKLWGLGSLRAHKSYVVTTKHWRTDWET
jgi:hypothetical protein